MNKSKFKIGDKIAVYSLNGDLVPTRVVCKVTKVVENGKALYTDQKGYDKLTSFDASYPVVQQCRKIKVKTKKHCDCKCK